MIWNSSVLPDPDGYREMNAEEILRDLFYNTKIYLRGKRIARDKGIYNINSTIFVPVRVICENLGITVDWNNSKIKLTKGKICVELKVNSDVAKVNGTSTKLNYKVFLTNNTSYVPLRLISESFGLNVKWDNNLKAVLLT